MPSIAQALKAEIVRISRKEIKASTDSIHKTNIGLRKTVTDFKKRIAALEAENKLLKSVSRKFENQKPEVTPEVAEKVRFTSKSIVILRNKLGLTQEQFGKIIGVSSQNIHAIEHKDGRLKFRSATLANLLSVRKLGKREAKKRLEEMGTNKNREPQSMESRKRSLKA